MGCSGAGVRRGFSRSRLWLKCSRSRDASRSALRRRISVGSIRGHCERSGRPRGAGVAPHRAVQQHPQLRTNLEVLGLGRLLEAVVCSADIGYEKPHENAYRHALEVAGDPAVRWMIGDSFEADVVGAERAAIPAILVRKNHPDAPRVASDLAAAALVIANGSTS